jgi:hypothetical protein
MKTDKEEKPLSELISVISVIFGIIFPWVELIKMNMTLSRISKFYKSNFFKAQKRKNLLFVLVSTAITYLPGFLCLLALKGNRAFNLRAEKVIELVSNFEISSALKIVELILSDKTFIFITKYTITSSLFGIIFSNLIIKFFHEIIVSTKKFKQILKKEGIIDENSSSSILFTPIGAFLDITGSSAKEIQNNERIWLAMNIEVKDYAQNPDKRSELFFKSAFNLKSRYDYVFKKSK